MSSIDIVVVFSSLVFSGFAQNLSARNFDSDCGQVYTKKQFVIESPNYPSNYPPNYQCSYLIKGPSCPTHFELQFLDFNLEDSLGCNKDRLEVEDKDAICGSKLESKHYFSEKGTLILRFVSDSNNTGRGYRFLVSRSTCVTPEDHPVVETTTQGIPKWHTTNKDVEYTTTTRRPVLDQTRKPCCQTVYNSKKFTLTSPNFPSSISHPAECGYEIRKANERVCRLRIEVKFFWLGRNSANCDEGSLEIDGRYLCGCKSNLKLTSSFIEPSSKFLRFVSRGFERNSYSGFIMEVTQDECPKKYVPEDAENETEPEFRFQNDQIHRVAHTNKFGLINENTEVLEDHGGRIDSSNQQVVRSVYVFADPDFYNTGKDREETDYVETSGMSGSLFPDNVDYGFCLNWNQQQFNSLSLRNLPTCKTSVGQTVSDRKCVELDKARGFFSSPGYPFFYPPNLNVCYRFRRLPGYCAMRVHMKDFQIQNGVDCRNDYLSSSNQMRYCGNRLMNTISTVNLRDKPYEEIHFVTDSFYCGRGFYGEYTQIACQPMDYPVNPTPPSPTPPYVPVPSPVLPCSRTVQQELFTLEVHDYNGPTCTFAIRKSSRSVCRVSLFFEQFDLSCAYESLVIDGTMYCGRLTGRTININVEHRDPVVVYSKRSNIGMGGLRFRIKGTQISDECPYPEVPAERSFKPNVASKTVPNSLLLQIGTQFKDICGIITNTTYTKLPETFCDIIMKNNNVTKCLPISENLLIVPLEFKKIPLRIKSADKTEQIEFEEVDCDDMRNL